MNTLSQKIVTLIEQGRMQVARTSNLAMVHTYFLVGKLIVDYLQYGEVRAGYGQQLLRQVSLGLNKHFGRGLSVQDLERMRTFCSIYSKSSNELRNSEVINGKALVKTSQLLKCYE